MNCPHCESDIPDGSATCPECGGTFQAEAAEQAKEERKSYTHYRVVLLSAGKRKGFPEKIAEITGLSVKEAEGYLRELPWTLATRIPFQEAQELKIITDRYKAESRIEGVDIWEEDDSEPERPQPKGKKRPGHMRIFILSGILLIIALIYILINLDKFQGQGILKVSDSEYTGPKISINTGDEKQGGAGEPGEETAGGRPLQTDSGNPFGFRTGAPDPFNPAIHIFFTLGQKQRVSLTVYDRRFIPVNRLVDGQFNAERYRVSWNGAADNGAKVRPDIYFVELIVDSGRFVRKMVWLSR